MARSIDTLYNAIIAEKTAQAELSGLTSDSKTAIFGLWAWVTAAVLYTVEIMHDLFRTEIDTLLRTLKPGTILWYQEMCKAYQYGDALVWSDSGYAYDAIDDTKKIVAQCSVTEGNGGLTVKIAREVSGELQPLTPEQEDAFAAYLSRRKYAGTRVNLVNANANLLQVSCAVYYDPLVISASGQNVDMVKPVEVAILAFLRSLPFNGRLRETALLAAIMQVPGVLDVSISALKQKYASAAETDIVISCIPESGYFKINPTHLLTDTITYIAGTQNV